MMSAKSVIAVSGISGNVTVAFVALSYAGGLNVTVVADPQRCPDLHDVAAALEQELRVLTGAGRRPSPGSPSPRARP